jgi:hypothetical protein
VKGPSNSTASIVIGGMFSIHQQKKNPGGINVFCSLDRENLPDLRPSVHRFAVEQAEALALAVDSVNANRTLLDGKTLGFAIRDTCGYLDKVSCPEELADNLVRENDVTATVVGPFYSDGDRNKKLIGTIEDIFRKLSNQNPVHEVEHDTRYVFPLLDIPELPRREQIDFRDTVRYVSQSCLLQARAAVDFLVQAGWQHIVLVTSADNCGVSISREFYDIVNKRECNFTRVHYFEEMPATVNIVLGSKEVNPTDISWIWTYKAFQSIASLTNPESIVVVLSSIPFAYTLLKDGLYQTNEHLRLTSEQKKNFTFLLGDFWGEPGEADLLYEVIKDLVRDTRQVVSLRAHHNGYEKFQHHMANLTSSSLELRRNRILGDYWSDYFNCTIGVNCNDTLSLPTVNRPILRNTAALLVIDAVYTAVEYIQRFYENFPHSINRSVIFTDSYRQELTVTSWTGNTFQMSYSFDTRQLLSYVKVVEWEYDILILKSAEEGQLDADKYGQWIMIPNGNLTVNNNMSGKLWRPRQILDICSTSPAQTPIPIRGKDKDLCSPNDIQHLVALPVVLLVILCVMGLIYGMTRGWISVQKSILKNDCFLFVLTVVTPANILVSFLIATDSVSSLSCEFPIADFLVNMIGCVWYVTILVAVLARGIGKKQEYFPVVFFLLVAVQIIISSVASFGNNDKQGNRTDDMYCVDMRSQPIVSVSYVYNGIIVLAAALVFLSTFRHLRIQTKPPSSYVSPVLGLILAIVYSILICIFIWTVKCPHQIQLLVVLSAYPAIMAACMLSWSVLTLCYEKVSKRRASTEFPERTNINEDHCVTSSHADSTMIAISSDFQDKDQEINEVLVEPSHMKVSMKIGKVSGAGEL